MGEKVVCPNCSHEFSVTLAAGIPADQAFTLTLRPAPGTMMQARTIGESIAGIADLHAAVSREHGITTTTLVRRINTADDGAVSVELALISTALDVFE